MSWEISAKAWIAAQAGAGDFSRRRVLDAPMLARVRQAAPTRLLDLGCGEGRFCRLLDGIVPDPVGIDPTAPLIAQARAQGGGSYVEGRAEELPFEAATFDMVVSYLSLLDIEGIEAALDEVRRVLRSGGRFLIANLTGFATASALKSGGWRARADEGRDIVVTRYLENHSQEVAWKDIRITNYHRPLSYYMSALLARDFALCHFDEPAVPNPQTPQDRTYHNAPYQLLMEWRLSQA